MPTDHELVVERYLRRLGGGRLDPAALAFSLPRLQVEILIGALSNSRSWSSGAIKPHVAVSWRRICSVICPKSRRRSLKTPLVGRAGNISR